MTELGRDARIVPRKSGSRCILRSHEVGEHYQILNAKSEFVLDRQKLSNPVRDRWKLSDVDRNGEEGDVKKMEELSVKCEGIGDASIVAHWATLRGTVDARAKGKGWEGTVGNFRNAKAKARQARAAARKAPARAVSHKGGTVGDSGVGYKSVIMHLVMGVGVVDGEGEEEADHLEEVGPGEKWTHEERKWKVAEQELGELKEETGRGKGRASLAAPMTVVPRGPPPLGTRDFKRRSESHDWSWRGHLERCTSAEQLGYGVVGVQYVLLDVPLFSPTCIRVGSPRWLTDSRCLIVFAFFFQPIGWRFACKAQGRKYEFHLGIFAVDVQ